ncbi:hypothetical protein MAR_008010 [Mya arenaria]|uniref:TNFR-Cys domain-containing protein n=1 Tax=Mya arenaria TaxID=6604 RepID=A0ABY7DXW7_MYAAR|nr:uncharacterized protein LOC128229753 [Mya arenaria]WAR01452.1 hypothetical protein MAR_008010 [Mya arenaria]
MAYRVVIIALSLVACGVAGSVSQTCGELEFYNNEARTCVPCRACPDGQVALRLCHDNRDTECGPFPWSMFHNSNPLPAEPVKATITSESQTSNAAAESRTASTVVLTDVSGEDRWFVITFVLVGVLVVAGVAAVISSIVLCYCCRQRKQREIICESTYVTTPLRQGDYIEQFQLVRET